MVDGKGYAFLALCVLVAVVAVVFEEHSKREHEYRMRQLECTEGSP